MLQLVMGNVGSDSGRTARQKSALRTTSWPRSCGAFGAPGPFLKPRRDAPGLLPSTAGAGRPPSRHRRIVPRCAGQCDDPARPRGSAGWRCTR
eukprot:8295956-Pyramimonas_sp.AAC.1